MPRTAREHALSWIGVIILFGELGVLYLIFGPNFAKNPILMVFVIFSFIFIMCWLFGYIHPNKWPKKMKQRKEYSYIKESHEISTPVSFQEETIPDNFSFISCPHCGALQEQGTTFCTKCGQKIE